MIWNKYDRDDKENCLLPPVGELVWVIDPEGYADLGYWVGWWEHYTGSDDISVIFWGELEYPPQPADFEEWRDELYGN